jgi:hypothetical protein
VLERVRLGLLEDRLEFDSDFANAVTSLDASIATLKLLQWK